MPEHDTSSKVVSLIRQKCLIPRGEVVVVGVSGGADSVCLLHVLAEHSAELGIGLHVAHLNHLMRGTEALEDAEYVSSLAAELGVPATVGEEDVATYRSRRKCSLEEAARELRYAFLGGVAAGLGAKRVAVGHTSDDQVETVLMHVLRGAGLSGLRGLEPCTRMALRKGEWGAGAGLFSREGSASTEFSVIRPLLGISRKEALDYCVAQRLAPRMDSSNLSLSLLRNRLRLELLPLLRQYNPGIDGAILRLALFGGEDDEFIEEWASLLWGELATPDDEAVRLDRARLGSLPASLQRRLLRLALGRIAGDVRDIESRHIEAARALLSKPAGKMAVLPAGLRCYGDYDELVVGPASWQPAPPSWLRAFSSLESSIPVTVPGEIVLAGWKMVVAVVPKRVGHPAGRSYRAEERESPEEGWNLLAELDAGVLGTDLVVRKTQPGDRFKPLGMNGSKKLREFMIDARIPRSWRDHIPVLCSHGRIAWVLGCRIDDRFKVDEHTAEVVRLELVEL